MIKKVLAILTAVVVVFAAGLALAHYYYPQDFQSGTTTVVPVLPTAQQGSNADAGSVSAITPTSVTISKPNGTTATLAITPSTNVISQVTSGEAGKSLGDITVGMFAVLVPDTTNVTTVQFINIVPPLSASSTAPIGTVQSVSATGITFDVTSSTKATTVEVTKNTKILTNVLAGQSGKSFGDIQAGDKVRVVGAASGSSIAAQSIQLLVPITGLSH